MSPDLKIERAESSIVVPKDINSIRENEEVKNNEIQVDKVDNEMDMDEDELENMLE